MFTSNDDKDREYFCEHCGKVFRRGLAFERHMDIHHSSSSKKPSSSAPHNCDVCGKTFATRTALTMHRSMHGDTIGLQVQQVSACPSPPFEETAVRFGMARHNGVDLDRPINGKLTDDVVKASRKESRVTLIDDVRSSQQGKIAGVGAGRGVDSVTPQSTRMGHPPSVQLSRTVPPKTVRAEAVRRCVKTANGSTPTRSVESPRSGTSAPEEDFIRSKRSGSVVKDHHHRVALSASREDAAEQSLEYSETLVEEIVSESLFRSVGQMMVPLSSYIDSKVVTWSTKDTGNSNSSGSVDLRFVQTVLERSSPSNEPEVLTTEEHLKMDVQDWKSRSNVIADSRHCQGQGQGGGRGSRSRTTGTSGRRRTGTCVQERTRSQINPQEMPMDFVDEQNVDFDQELQKIDDIQTSTTTTMMRTTNGGSSRTPYVCALCNRDFISEKYLSMHMSLHKPYMDGGGAAAANSATTLVDAMNPVVESSSEMVVVGGGGGLQLGLPPGVKQKKMAATTTITEVQQWTCQYCNKSFVQNSNYKNHMRTHSDERPFVCEICCIGFKERYHLKKHVLFKHTTDLKETCRVCGKCFKDSTAVRAHERIHSEVRPYGCGLCGKTFKTSECLWHHENRSKTCGKSAMRRGDVNALSSAEPAIQVRRTRRPRQTTTGGTTKAKTNKQSQKGSDVTTFNDRTVQDLTTAALTDDQKQSAAKTASVRAAEQEKEESLLMDIKTEPDCDLFDSNLQTILQSTDPELDNIWEFLNLDKDMSSPDENGSDMTDSERESLLRGYEDFNATGKGLECTKCAKKFSSSATFEKHMVMHNEERPYRCTLCDNGFKLKVHLKKHHLYRHSNEYPCECSICGKRFKDSSAVRLHERIHSSDRPFRCHCGKGFKTRENLWGHRNRGPCEKTQDFIANNIRLFRSTEFGSILGVPVDPGQSLDGAAFTSNVKVIDRASAAKMVNIGSVPRQVNLQTVLVKNGDGIGGTVVSVPNSVQLVQTLPSCVINASCLSTVQLTPAGRSVKVATLRLIKPRAGDISTTTTPTFILPTAIVTPIQRDAVQTTQKSSSPPQNICSAEIDLLAKLTVTTEVNNTQIRNIFDSSSIKAQHNNSPDLIPATFQKQQILSTAPVRSGSEPTGKEALMTGVATIQQNPSSLADKCPTVQKYLRMSQTSAAPPPTPAKFPEINQLLRTTSEVNNGVSRSSSLSIGRRNTERNANLKKSMGTAAIRRTKLNSVGEEIRSNSMTDENAINYDDLLDDSQSIVCESETQTTTTWAAVDEEEMDCQDPESGDLSKVDPLLPHSPFTVNYPSMYPADLEEYCDTKYDPNDPSLNIGDMFWGDSDNTLSSGWTLENESLFSELSLITSNFGIPQ